MKLSRPAGTHQRTHDRLRGAAKNASTNSGQSRSVASATAIRPAMAGTCTNSWIGHHPALPEGVDQPRDLRADDGSR